MSIIGLLVAVILLCLVWWGVTRLMAAFGVGDPIATVVRVLLVVLFILWLVGVLGYGVPGLRLR